MTSLAPIAFIDSGIGGLPYLANFRAALPGAPLLYVADNRNFPYGQKSESEVRQAALDMTGRLVAQRDPALIIVACNTASMLALDALRSNFAYEFVGVVPAVKPAAKASRSRVVGVMATERALQGAYFDKLVAEFGGDCIVVRFAATELINAIETDPFMTDKSYYIQLMEEIRHYFLSRQVDTIVLGCTHFLHLNQEMLSVFGKDFTILDSRQGVTRQSLRLLQDRNVLYQYQAATASPQPGVFHLTASVVADSMYPRVAAAYDLTFGGEL